MITVFLLDHPELMPVALLLIALACAGVGYLLLRTRRQRVLWVLAAVSMLPVLALTLKPTRGRTSGCVVEFDLPSLGSVELLANIAMFVPPVFFATLATGRPLSMLAAGAGLSAVIEAVQALVPAIGRACDTNDWVMNTAGTILAVLLALATIRLARPR